MRVTRDLGAIKNTRHSPTGNGAFEEYTTHNDHALRMRRDSGHVNTNFIYV